MKAGTISLYVKVIDTDVFEHKDGYEVHIDCLGLDCTGKALNVSVVTNYENLDKLIELTKASAMREGSIYLLSGEFCNDSDDKHDVLTIYGPTFEPVSGEDLTYHVDLFDKYQIRKGDFLLRKDSNVI